MRNWQHFGQVETKCTPFNQESLKTKFNCNALTHESELVLEGKYTDNNLTKVQQLFIDHLQKFTSIDKFDEKIMYEDMGKKWNFGEK